VFDSGGPLNTGTDESASRFEGLSSDVFQRTIGGGKEGLQILYGRARTYYDSNLVPNTTPQYRNQFNSLRAALYFWTASMFGNSSIPPNNH
jgi:hypothetical protein